MTSPYSNHGRGTVTNPGNRFEQLHVEEDAGAWEEIAAIDPDAVGRRPKTRFYRDDSKSIISSNQSPDLGFDRSVNPYRGCEHGCAYCYARPYHEYLGFNSGLDFETRIMVKEKAPELLEQELARKSWTPQSVVCSGVTDCYQPFERQFQITRQCLEVLAEFRNPVGIVTKNALVTRDIDVLSRLAEHGAAAVVLSITSLDSKLSNLLEPRASRPQARLEAVEKLHRAGIPVGISIAPVIPGLNEHEIPAIIEAAAERGAQFASGSVVRLPFQVREIFSNWLDQHFPERKELVLGRIRELREGQLNDSQFGARMTGRGPLAEQIQHLIAISIHRHGLGKPVKSLSTAAFRRLLPGQKELF